MAAPAVGKALGEELADGYIDHNACDGGDQAVEEQRRKKAAQQTEGQQRARRFGKAGKQRVQHGAHAAACGVIYGHRYGHALGDVVQRNGQRERNAERRAGIACKQR